MRAPLQERLAESGAIMACGSIGAVVVIYLFTWLADEVLDQQTMTLDRATLAFLHHFSSPSLATVVSLFGSEMVWIIARGLVVAFG